MNTSTETASPLIDWFDDGDRERDLTPVAAGDAGVWWDGWDEDQFAALVSWDEIDEQGSQQVDGRVVGWRVEPLLLVRGRLQLGVPRRDLNRAVCDRSRLVDEPTLTDGHDVPAADCTCGFRLVRDLGNLSEYVAQSHRMGVVQRPYKFAGWLFAQASATGRVEGPSELDPPNTIRVSSFRYEANALVDQRTAFRQGRLLPALAKAAGFRLHVVPDLALVSGGWA